MVVRLLTDQVGSDTRIDVPPSDSQLCCAATESPASTVFSVRSANSSLVVDVSLLSAAALRLDAATRGSVVAGTTSRPRHEPSSPISAIVSPRLLCEALHR